MNATSIVNINSFYLSSIVRVILISAASLIVGAQAADWSDTSLGWRAGNDFREPFNDKKISKNIINLTHASGYKYGANFFNVDFLQSNSKDPAAITPGGETSGSAQEAYVVYRHTLDIGKIAKKDLGWGWINGYGVTGGFDWNSKTDATYNSKKRMLVLGPTMMLKVPGYLNVSLLMLWESNAPSGYSFFTNSNYSTPRYYYKTHPMLTLAWGVPVGLANLSFEGYANFIASKGKDEFGGDTKVETNIDASLMYDIGAIFGAKGLRAGLGFQYWKNKFGNNSGGAAGDGAFAKTAMIKLDYHF